MKSGFTKEKKKSPFELLFVPYFSSLMLLFIKGQLRNSRNTANSTDSPFSGEVSCM